MVTGGDAEDRTTPYINLGWMLEFSRPTSIEWFDGRDYDASEGIVSVRLTRDQLLIGLETDMGFAVSFQLSDKEFATLTSYLSVMFEPGSLTETGYDWRHPGT